MKIISLCDYTGNMVKPWAEAGYECICVDTQHSIRNDKTKGNITYVWGDVRSWWPASFDDVAAVFAFPPCTHLAVSGARDFRKKGLTLLIDALQLIESCRRICEASGAPYLLENPVSTISSYWRKPDFVFNPNEYAGYLDNPEKEAYTKKTCLWTGGGFIMPEKKEVLALHGSKMHLLPPSSDRANLRSATALGFASAVFQANSKTMRKAA